MDTGALKKAQPETIRVLVWLLSFLGFGYATAEFEGMFNATLKRII